MISPNYPDNESQRLLAVESYQLLDTAEEEDFDDLTKMVSTLLEAPIALVTLLDTHRNYLKSHHGVPFNESPREISFCGHAILEDSEIFVIEDAREDARFHDNPLVCDHNAIFYAGVPLINSDGYKLGTLCIFDHRPRQLDEAQQQILKTIAKQVIQLFELRKKNRLLIDAQALLVERNDDLKSFASVVSHDLKSPLANITSLVALLRLECTGKISGEAKEYLQYLEESSETLRSYIDGILNYYKTDKLLSKQGEDFLKKDFFYDIAELFSSEDFEISYPDDGKFNNVNKSALGQIFINLISNAFKYNSKSERKVTIDVMESKKFYHFTVEDNGDGIPESAQTRIFQLFETCGKADRNGKLGSGIGLSTVKNLVMKMGGTLTLTSKVNEGTKFTFTVKK